ncbi:MAG: type II toxin-antitoxin system HicA family toxin [Magnetococcales bacterium]|nr:type II toxin-antitoxin system HicA family toxin [Magnetococcales bacterium]
MNTTDLIRLLTKDGWFLIRITGSHHHFRHETKPGIVTVPHPQKGIKTGTLHSILKQVGLE